MAKSRKDTIKNVQNILIRGTKHERGLAVIYWTKTCKEQSKDIGYYQIEFYF